MGFAVLICICGGRVASAQEQTPDHLEDSSADGKLEAAERDQQAREKFNEGRQAYESGEYRDAWDYFRQAYVLSRRPELLYNVGQSADRLGLHEEALKAFRMYLRDAKEPANRRDVENRIRALDKTVQRNKETGVDDADGGQGGAAGEDAASADSETIELPTAPERDQPTREGWYLRAALGLGVLFDAVDGGGVDTSISGGGLSGEIALGRYITPEIVLGGGLFAVLVPTPKRKDGGELEKANLILFGPMIDYYWAPVTDGFHIQGGLGVGTLNMSREATEGDTAGTKPANGFGIFAGAGYEWPIHPEVAAGVLARMMAASATENDVHEHAMISASVIGTATWY